MLRTKPKLRYCGLSVILSNPSRFDKIALLTANGGVLFNTLLQPDYNKMQCDIRLADDKSPFLEGTKCILLLGEHAMHTWAKNTGNNTLNELRGSPLYVGDIPAIASFLPQEAADIKNHEQQLNPDSKDFAGEEDSEDGEDEDSVKSFSRTKHSNYAFWLASDIRKCKEILRTGAKEWTVEKQPTYKIYPSAEEVISVLTNTKGKNLYFDIETDYEEQNLLCFSFAFGTSEVYSVPVLNTDYHWAYSSLHLIIRALVQAIRDNTLVAHNGAGFDFFVLTNKYHIPVYKCYDTMLAMHRCFPDVEKSLGHCVSYWTMQRFHKDTDSRAYRTQEHLMAKLKYCGKDVFTLALIHEAIEKYAKTIPGLSQSIECANRSIRPYLITTLTGIRYSEEKVKKICSENDALMMQYLRIIAILIGDEGMNACRKAVKGKAKAFPTSNAQCVNYFHEQLGYPVVMRSTKTGKPTLGKKCLYKLALRFPDNPVITFTLMYRIIQKEYSALKFVPWKDDNNKVINYAQYVQERNSEI